MDNASPTPGTSRANGFVVADRTPGRSVRKPRLDCWVTSSRAPRSATAATPAPAAASARKWFPVATITNNTKGGYESAVRRVSRCRAWQARLALAMSA
jgi:hypothetical protein